MYSNHSFSRSKGKSRFLAAVLALLLCAALFSPVGYSASAGDSFTVTFDVPSNVTYEYEIKGPMDFAYPLFFYPIDTCVAATGKTVVTQELLPDKARDVFISLPYNSGIRGWKVNNQIFQISETSSGNTYSINETSSEGFTVRTRRQTLSDWDDADLFVTVPTNLIAANNNIVIKALFDDDEEVPDFTPSLTLSDTAVIGQTNLMNVNMWSPPLAVDDTYFLDEDGEIKQEVDDKGNALRIETLTLSRADTHYNLIPSGASGVDPSDRIGIIVGYELGDSIFPGHNSYYATDRPLVTVKIYAGADTQGALVTQIEDYTLSLGTAGVKAIMRQDLGLGKYEFFYGIGRLFGATQYTVDMTITYWDQEENARKTLHDMKTYDVPFKPEPDTRPEVKAAVAIDGVLAPTMTTVREGDTVLDAMEAALEKEYPKGGSKGSWFIDMTNGFINEIGVDPAGTRSGVVDTYGGYFGSATYLLNGFFADLGVASWKLYGGETVYMGSAVKDCGVDLNFNGSSSAEWTWAIAKLRENANNDQLLAVAGVPSYGAADEAAALKNSQILSNFLSGIEWALRTDITYILNQVLYSSVESRREAYNELPVTSFGSAGYLPYLFRTYEPFKSAYEELLAYETDAGGIHLPAVTADEALIGVLDYAQNNITPEFGGDRDWFAMTLGRAWALPIAWRSSYLESAARQTGLTGTEAQRLALALTALGEEADVSSFDSISAVSNLTINGKIFALLALDSKPYYGQQDLILDAILESEIDGGGWGLNGMDTDVDTTAMAMQALAPYYQRDNEVKAAVDRAKRVLKAAQQPNGGFTGWDSSEHSACSDAQVIVALTALGINPADWGTMGGQNPLTAMLLNYNENGKWFGESANAQYNEKATSQAAYALVAYNRYINGLCSLYDMRDAFSAENLGADITAAKTKIASAAFAAAQSEIADDDAALSKVKTIIGALDLNGVTASVTGGTFTGATEGDSKNVNGTNGSYTFTVSLAKGAGTPQTYDGTLTITATAYSPSAASQIKTYADYGGEIALEGTTFTITTITGYKISAVVVDGEALTAIDGSTVLGATSLTIDEDDFEYENIRSIVVTFAYTLSFNIPANGTLSVSRGGDTLTSGSIVRGGEVLTIEIAPDDGYELDAENSIFSGLTRDGTSDSWTVTADFREPPSIHVAFKEKEIVSDETVTVSFRLIGDAVHGLTDAPQYSEWIPTREVKLSGSGPYYVYDAFLSAINGTPGISQIGAESNYVTSITMEAIALIEKGNGSEYSGWKYLVNGEYADKGLRDQPIQNGDAIVWHYINDYPAEDIAWAEAYPGIPVLTGISVTKSPNQASYDLGDQLKLAGLQITATYEGGATAVIPYNTPLRFGVSHANNDVLDTAGTLTVTVTYQGKATTFDVTVSDGAAELAAAKMAKIAQIEAVDDGLTESDYTVESWAFLQTAIQDAIEAVNDAAAIGDVYGVAVPTTGVLVTVAADLESAKTAKITAINAVPNGLTEDDYTAESWNDLQTAIADAILSVNAATTVEEVNGVTVPVTDGLVTVAAELAAAKAAKIAQIEAVDDGLTASDYTYESWTMLQTAITAALSEVNSAATANAVNAVALPSADVLIVKPDEPDPEPANYSAALANALGYLRSSVESPGFGTGGGEWTILALARGGYIEPTYYDGYYNRVLAEISGKTKLDENKSTENSRAIIGLTAIGLDASNIGGTDLVSPLTDTAWVSKQGINGPIFALISLDAKDYLSETALRQTLIGAILDAEIPSGGWSLGGATPDPDVTAMALQALALYRTQTGVQAAVNRATAWLDSLATTDSEGLSQIIVAYSAIGIDASGYVTRLIDGYCDESTGGFKRDGTVDAMATDQAAYALVAYDRYKNGVNALYRMSDAARLVSAEMSEKPSSDKTALNAEIARAESISRELYTDSSWSHMQTALTVAKSIAAKTDVTQKAIDDAKNALTAAISGLKIPSGGGTPSVTRFATIGVADPGAPDGQPSVYYGSRSVEISSDETAFTLLQKTGLNLRYSGHREYAGYYVEAINDFGEFDDGENSGWMYSVNGVFPGYSSSLYYLENGDVVRWLYTRDLGNDIDASYAIDYASSSGGNANSGVTNNDADTGSSTTTGETDISDAPTPSGAFGGSQPDVVSQTTVETTTATPDETGKATAAVETAKVTEAVAEAVKAVEAAKADGKANAVA
ncbi:MAG: DUF4430 domain-containing protein, partial [Oscillospiraceae bacterium]|nr:DUF4430 domain-containing protein [Oscillospiraceae bacterium]